MEMGGQEAVEAPTTGSCLVVPPLTSQAALFSMAKRPLLLLLAMGVLAGELWTEAQAAPYRVKLCGREFIRAVIFTCGGSRWRRSDILAYEAMGEAGEVLYVCQGHGQDTRWVQGARDGGEMRGWGRGVPPPPHAAGEMGQALKAVSRLGEPDEGGAASHPHQLKVCCYLGAPCQIGRAHV